MSDIIIARRYAQALRQEADESGITEKVDADVALIRESLTASGELLRFFESPVISREKKSTVVRKLFEGRIEALTLRFLLLMVEKQREQIFPQVVQAYADARDEQLGIVNVSVRVAKTMSEEEETQLSSTIEKMIEKRVRLQTLIDGSLLGGLVVRIGDTLYDGSFANQLKSLRERLEAGQVATNNR